MQLTKTLCHQSNLMFMSAVCLQLSVNDGQSQEKEIVNTNQVFSCMIKSLHKLKIVKRYVLCMNSFFLHFQGCKDSKRILSEL